MLKCLWIRRKLYDYLDNNLSDLEKIRVSNHLNSCSKCSERLGQIRNILDWAAQEKTPQPTEEFWHNFKVDLDAKLNQRLVPPFAIERRFSFRLKPVLAYALALVLILMVGSYFYKNYTSGASIVKQDEALTNELVILDEISGSPYLNHDEDAYLEEIDLFYELGQDLT